MIDKTISSKVGNRPGTRRTTMATAQSKNTNINCEP